MTCIVLVRHGQTEWNIDDRFRGRVDVPLDETGLRQAKLVAKRIAREWQPAAIYASPLERTLKTAETIAARFGLEVQDEPGLIDINAGDWQGLTHEQVKQRWPELYQTWFTSPQSMQIPGGEGLQQVRERASAAVRRLAGQYSDQTLVLVTHAAVIRTILLSVLRLGNERFWHLAQGTCAINVLEWKDDDFTVEMLNDTDHLKPWKKSNSVKK